jgi:Uma2 family endonuclease
MTIANAPVRITPEDLLRMPDNNSLELINGKIVEKQVSAKSSETEGSILFVIKEFLKNKPTARVFPATLGYRCFADQARFPLIWMVYPEDRTVMVYPLGQKQFILTSDDIITAENVLSGFSCKVAELFPTSILASGR